MTARELFRSIFTDADGDYHPNFMAPEPVEYGYAGEYPYELAHGRFMRRDLWGVTVLDPDDPENAERRHKLSTSFNSRSKAEDYLLRLEAGDVEG